MGNQSESSQGLAAKILALWAWLGVTNWSEAASFFTTMLTVYMIGRYIWRDIGRPFCERRGWIAQKAATNAAE